MVDSKYLTSSALSELINALVQSSTNVAHIENNKLSRPSRKLNEQVSCMFALIHDANVLYIADVENQRRLLKFRFLSAKQLRV